MSEWIDRTIRLSRKKSRPVIELNFPRINGVFPKKLLKKTRVVIVPDKPPFPPLNQMGLAELYSLEQLPIAGITYKDTFFVNRNHVTESLHFHELIHVVQWERLGMERFLLAYGVGLIQFGYKESPLEQMAYNLQRDFDREIVPDGIVELIYRKTDDLWSKVIEASN